MEVLLIAGTCYQKIPINLHYFYKRLSLCRVWDRQPPKAWTEEQTYPERTPSTRFRTKKEPMMMRGMKYNQFQLGPKASSAWNIKKPKTFKLSKIKSGWSRLMLPLGYKTEIHQCRCLGGCWRFKSECRRPALNRDIMWIDLVGLTERVWRRVEVFCTGEELVYEANIETESCIYAPGSEKVNMMNVFFFLSVSCIECDSSLQCVCNCAYVLVCIQCWLN